MVNKSTCAESKWAHGTEHYSLGSSKAQILYIDSVISPKSPFQHELNAMTLTSKLCYLLSRVWTHSNSHSHCKRIIKFWLDPYFCREHCVNQWIICTAPTGRRSEHGDWHLIIWSAVSRGVDPTISVRQVQMITVPSDSWHWQMSG